MTYELASLPGSGQSLLTSTDELRRRIDHLFDVEAPRYRRLWEYYRNPLTALLIRSDASGSERPYRQAHEWGMPSRITGFRSGGGPGSAPEMVDGVSRKEVVVENDIAWRIDTLVDYLFGKPLVIESAAPDARRRQTISHLLRLIIAHNGGIQFFQQLALLGAVYGYVDVLVKFDASAASHVATEDDTNDVSASLQQLGQASASNETLRDVTGPSHQQQADAGENDAGPSSPAPPPAAPAPQSDDSSATGNQDPARLQRLARCIRFEIVEPARALPLLSPIDYRIVEAYAQVYRLPRTSKASRKSSLKSRWFERLFRSSSNGTADDAPEQITVVELLTADRWQRYEDETLVAQGTNSLGQIPLVHIQNLAVPFQYAGASDVEPLLPLQDELNTRLSDRAHRIALQSFKMYLGKGIENFGALPVAPGRMWMTDNDNAQVVEFGGDSGCPSEESHVREVREAMDKTSAVTPIAAGAIKGRIGRLTSAAALRVTLLALLAKTERKRTTYGAGIARMCELSLNWLDRAGLFFSTEQERQVQLHWPSPLPANESERLADAEAKLRIGISSDIVLRELGY